MAHDVIQLAQRSIAEGRADRAIHSLRRCVEQNDNDFAAWKLLGIACHEEQLEHDAAHAFAKAAALDLQDAAAAMGLAQCTYLSGLAAADLFRNLLRLQPGDLRAQRGLAQALAAEGQPIAAESALLAGLVREPAWLEGHKALTSLRYTTGDRNRFAESYAQACTAQPGNLALRLEWFRAVAQVRDWDGASEIVREGERIFGVLPSLQIARLFIASESGDVARAIPLFAATESLSDPVRDMAWVRHGIRTGDLASAETTAARNIDTPLASVFWPYLALIWRLRGDPRAEWLEGSSSPVSVIDLALEDTTLAELGEVLRKLHIARSPFAEQSVRGGTQTDQNLFLRHEPVLQALKARVQRAVGDYVARLPPPVQGHPLLGVSRDEVSSGRVFFSGSWSVRLGPQGHNISHTHPMGWISSALYISVPQSQSLGPAPAGWLQFGTPPADLNLTLQPALQLEPKAGHLVLFGSRTWHRTVPFFDGERLVVSFDVRLPRVSERIA